MQFGLRAVLSLLAAIVAAFALLTPVASAAPAPELPGPVTAVLDRLAAGNPLDAADRAVLVSYPEVAAQVLDPDRATVESTGPQVADTTEAPVVAGGGPHALGAGCWTWDYKVYGYTVLGFVAYVFHHEVHWCTNGSTVLGMHYRNAWPSELDGNMYWRGLVGNSATPTPNWEAQSFMQGAIENCVLKYGCIRTNYPWSRIYLYGNGDTSVGWGH
ncbi:hypothetical protein [Actinosynnema sp. NPDC020468]|uniref:hypothetical protein n=1 Tax=Actinosynnema sp. NPDC020468 TaxID=3154488 RepID=UPI003405002B